MNGRNTLGLVAVVALLAGCGGAPFAERDPRGYEACSEWAGYLSEGGAVAVIGGSLVVADIARKSSTPEIRESVTNLLDDEAATATGDQFGKLDTDRLEAACESEGFEFKDSN